jgi:hypothetical protein
MPGDYCLLDARKFNNLWMHYEAGAPWPGSAPYSWVA